MARERADVLLVRRGLSESRARAQADIADGLVMSGARPVLRPSERLEPEAPLDVRRTARPFVSRGGDKLAHALDVFAIDPAGLIALDLGASTGGFSDVLLSRGARRVYAVDVGHGQLHPRLRADPRVIVLERTDARALTAALVPEPFHLLVADLSFIGLAKALGPALALARPNASLVVLVKPQFEVGPTAVGKGGIVRNERDQHSAVEQVSTWLAAQPGWQVKGLAESALRGGDGNREFFLAAQQVGPR